MRKTRFIIFAILIGTTSILGVSCAKEKGCMDKNSITYNPDAKEDDGSCKYQGKHVFWYKEAVASKLVAAGVTALAFIVDGQVVGSSAASIYWSGSSAPDCGQDGSITVTYNLGTEKSKTCAYKVLDQDQDVHWSGSVTFEANTCTAVELTL